jgi:hypothetical protein
MEDKCCRFRKEKAIPTGKHEEDGMTDLRFNENTAKS